MPGLLDFYLYRKPPKLQHQDTFGNNQALESLKTEFAGYKEPYAVVVCCK